VLRSLERWVAIIRLVAVPFAIFQVAVSSSYPPGYAFWGWGITIAFCAGSVVLFGLSRMELSERALFRVGLGAQVFDTAIVCGFVVAFSYEANTPVRQLLYLPLVEGCVRFGIAGGFAVALVSVPTLVGFSELHDDRFHERFRYDFITLQIGLELLMALLVGWLVRRLAGESARAGARAEEAEALRDELGRRVDVLDATNRCARALSSSLDGREAFAAFIRELQALVPFERVAIVLAEDGQAQVIATAGAGADVVFPPGSHEPAAGTLLVEALASGRPIYRPRLDPSRYPEELAFVGLGLHSRLVAPLLTGARAIGMLSLLRSEEDAFSEEEVELVGLLGRLVAAAAQNLRSYELERRTVDELRRLSTLRADFVSLVSHELRTPMAAMVGAGLTLKERWRDLAAEQRDAFLGLIVTETERLARLVGEVLDTSRIDAGTFSYRFDRVDLTGLLEEATAAATLAQHEVPVVLRVPQVLPVVEGDSARLRQVLANLIDNAVKYSPSGQPVEVRATAAGAGVAVDVVDRGPGIAASDQQLVFEKFGRVQGANAKPGTGLGLYIAKAIAEAHGGALEVQSTPGLGATFTLTLPTAGAAAG